MKNNALLGVLVLALAILACSTDLPNPTPTLTPIAAATATPLPWSDMAATLTSIGFKQTGKDDCGKHNPCTEWFNSDGILVTVYGDGVVGYTYPTGASLRMIAVLFQIYPPDVVDWYGSHPWGSKELQKGDVGDFVLYMQFYGAHDNVPELNHLEIHPKVPASVGT